ncbi:MAG: hypothetical protein WC144_00925 [Sulfurimonas sp.]|jgi:hypothetical protein|nr:hypothetical protein [Sulfurimonadaceae bacterium]
MQIWLNRLKVAIVERDTALLEELLESIPQHTQKSELQSAIALMQEASDVVKELRDETFISMEQLKKNLKFLESDATPMTGRLDIKY